MATVAITVVETTAFSRQAEKRMTAQERHAAIDMIAYDPECGDLIQGTGGIRKVRFGTRGRGKRGGVRLVYYYYNEAMPVFMLTVFAKNERDDLSMAERNALATTVIRLRESYGS